MFKNNKIIAATVASFIAFTQPAFADNKSDIQSLRQELNKIQNTYEKRISDLETKLEDKQQINNPISKPDVRRRIFGNQFNPSVGMVLNGRYSTFSEKESEFAGFAVGEEGKRGGENFSLGETELNVAANIDDKFYGSMTASIVREDGQDKIELEEAFVRTRPELGLPTGLELKFGRAFWNIGYLNQHHTHTDDFADRPLPYRAFLNTAFNDDGIQASYVLPTDFYAEIGGGTFRGEDFPSANGSGNSAYSAYARIGSDIGDNQNWRVGAYVLSSQTKGDGRQTNEDAVTFIGDSKMYIADFRYTFAPTGNSKNQELTFQAEYFHREEDGTYEDTDAATNAIEFDDSTSGWYAQAVYKFLPQWRVGLRYSELLSANTPTGLVGSALDAQGHNPKSYSAMLDWTNSEYSRVRFQYNNEELANNIQDNHFIVQYIMSFGAHSAHKY